MFLQGSSRSHCIFAITVEQAKVREATGEQHITVGKLNMVDLAGSERQGKTGATVISFFILQQFLDFQRTVFVPFRKFLHSLDSLTG